MLIYGIYIKTHKYIDYYKFILKFLIAVTLKQYMPVEA